MIEIFLSIPEKFYTENQNPHFNKVSVYKRSLHEKEKNVSWGKKRNIACHVFKKMTFIFGQKHIIITHSHIENLSKALWVMNDE